MKKRRETVLGYQFKKHTSVVAGDSGAHTAKHSFVKREGWRATASLFNYT